MKTMSSSENTNTTKNKSSVSDLQSTNTKKNKSSVSETGHAKNIANFQDLISFCQGYGAIYNPSKESLRITALLDQYQKSLDKLYQLKTQKTSFDIATNNRRNEFENLKTFTTKVLNAFMVSGAEKLAIDDVKAINRKIQGPKYQKTKTGEETTTEEIKRISTSQQSYDRFIDHFANLLQVLEQNPIYIPNEEELKLTSLQTKFEIMKTVNTNLINAYTEYSKALIQRNQALYDGLTGLVQIAKEVKLYVKSIYGTNSPQYNQIKAIEFKTIKKL